MIHFREAPAGAGSSVAAGEDGNPDVHVSTPAARGAMEPVKNA
jgi:hypothetical protein